MGHLFLITISACSCRWNTGISTGRVWKSSLYHLRSVCVHPSDGKTEPQTHQQLGSIPSKSHLPTTALRPCFSIVRPANPPEAPVLPRRAMREKPLGSAGQWSPGEHPGCWQWGSPNLCGWAYSSLEGEKHQLDGGIRNHPHNKKPMDPISNQEVNEMV